MVKGYMITYSRLKDNCNNRFKYAGEYYHRCSYGRIKTTYTAFKKCSEKLCPILKVCKLKSLKPNEPYGAGQ